ncbi:MAG TPA: GlsB/YeaQ/YmgE family stress response membrane protein [Eubacteriaceae bacterium]|nr:GlsB/YeaQ/YmgE family stress response membrane protein [Eubacteriaceae bacterium]
MGFLSWILFGAIAGWIATMFKRKNKGGLLKNIITGIIGAFVGGLIFETLGYSGVTGFNFWSIFVAVIGAIVFLTILNILKF